MLSNSEPARGLWSPGQSPGHCYRHWSHTWLDLGQKWQTDSGGDLPLVLRLRCCSALMSGTQLNIEKSCFEWISSWISVTCPFWWKIGHDKCHHKFLNRQYQYQWQFTDSDCLNLSQYLLLFCHEYSPCVCKSKCKRWGRHRVWWGC